ncbi:hypothetical protein D3C87_1836820 [compost metagenome]
MRRIEERVVVGCCTMAGCFIVPRNFHGLIISLALSVLAVSVDTIKMVHVKSEVWGVVSCIVFCE